MSDIFREVEEDVRREQLKKLWDRFGPFVIGAAVLIVLVTAGIRGWEWYSARQAAQLGAEYYDAMQLSNADKPDEAEAAFNAIASKGGGFSALARLRAATARGKAGDLEGAVADYDAVASGAGVETDLRNVARIRAGYVLLELGDQAGVEQRVGELAEQGNHWRNSARELLGLAAYQAGDLEAATKRFEEVLADNETPQDMRGRVQLMMSLLAADRPASTDASDANDNDGGEAADQ